VWSALLGTAAILPLASGDFVAQVLALSAGGWASVLYLSLLSTVAANLILYSLVSRQEVSRLSIQLYLVPVVSVAGGVLILGETVNALTVIGGGVLLLAVGLATRR
jgi:drug/metabolite transporter (DMT)-like permease